MLRTCSRGHRGPAINGVCPTCRRIAEEEREEIDLAETRIPPAEDDHGATFHPEPMEG